MKTRTDRILAIDPGPEQSGWVVWMDEDILITNDSLRLTDFIQLFGTNKNIIISEDCIAQEYIAVPINSGLFFLS